MQVLEWFIPEMRAVRETWEVENQTVNVRRFNRAVLDCFKQCVRNFDPIDPSAAPLKARLQPSERECIDEWLRNYTSLNEAFSSCFQAEAPEHTKKVAEQQTELMGRQEQMFAEYAAHFQEAGLPPPSPEVLMGMMSGQQ